MQGVDVPGPSVEGLQGKYTRTHVHTHSDIWIYL